MDARERYDGPPFWFVIFGRLGQRRDGHGVGTLLSLMDWLSSGRFKHVMAVGYFPNARCWMTFNPTLRGMAVDIVRAEEAGDYLDRVAAGGGVLKVYPGQARRRMFRAYYCVPCVAALVGSRSSALLPDTLWRDLIAEGAEIVQDGLRSQDVETRSGIGAAEASR